MATSEPIKTASCVGVPDHERTLIRLAIETRPRSLAHTWMFGDPQEADVLFVKPAANGVRKVSRHNGSTPCMIAVTDSDTVDSPQTQFGDPRLVLRRPLTPAMVAEALNTVDERAAGAAVPAEPVSEMPRSMALDEALHKAMTDTPCSGRWEIRFEDNGDTVVLEPERDRLSGAVNRLLRDALQHRPTVHLTDPGAKAAADSPGEHKIHPSGLYVFLWNLGWCKHSGAALFGDPACACVRLSRWPHVAAMNITRVEMRAITMLYRRRFNVDQASRMTGMFHSDVILLLNGIWLTGDLITDEANAAPAASQPPRTASQQTGNRVSASLASRIRKRLTGAS